MRHRFLQNEYTMRQFVIELPPFQRGFHIIDDYLFHQITLPANGLLHLFLQHTSAGICINENADPTVRIDFETVFNKLVPEGMPYYKHTLEGVDDMPAHIKAALVGHSLCIPIINGELALGTWQGIYLCEFRNMGGSRNIVVSIFEG